MKTHISRIVILTLWGLAALGDVTPPTEESVLDTLERSHPRLMLSNEDLGKLKSRYESDVALQRYASQVKDDADRALTKPALAHKLIGPRLLSVSRECLDRVYVLALAFRWTQDERYAKAAESNLLAVSAFPDWNPSHFLDTAEMSHAVGVGYDWLYDWLSDESKKVIRAALIEKGMKPGIEVYKKGGWWTISEFNWNQVCNAGMIVGALAIADTDPEFAQFIVPRAVRSMPRALRAYDPDGAWTEGPSYWHYATRYTAYGLCALQTALGTDFGLSDMPGLRATGHFPWYTTGPAGLFLNYADSGERATHKPMPCMFWLARHFRDAAIADAEHALLADSRASAEHIVWYVPTSGQASTPRDLDRWFKSTVDIIVMRSAWDDPDALFVGVKGGYNQVNHGHLDLGNFELDALGERWARDLGSDDYNLPGYFDKKKGGKRWLYYRNISESHSVPLVGGKGQDEAAKVSVIDFQSSPDGARVSLDLTDAYKDRVESVKREIALTDQRRAVVVRDRFDLAAPAELVWAMTTDAAIEVGQDGIAVLTLRDKKLRARILEPTGASFSTEPCTQDPPQKQNKGVQRLLVRVEGKPGPAEICVQLVPAWPD
ncbi:MAG: heparinase II/III family protein [Candidatus Hydrogenedentes bacterium]|nr:heparinase II/III family protein [Candidatus Hydrogenedentota bacterium]